MPQHTLSLSLIHTHTELVCKSIFYEAIGASAVLTGVLNNRVNMTGNIEQPIWFRASGAAAFPLCTGDQTTR